MSSLVACMDGDATFNGKKSSHHRRAMNLRIYMAVKDQSVGPSNLGKEGHISRSHLEELNQCWPMSHGLHAWE